MLLRVHLQADNAWLVVQVEEVLLINMTSTDI